MQILELDAQRVSLEFSPEEASAVFAELQIAVGHDREISRRAFATYDLIGAGPESFILMDDWDEPCLISQTKAGDALSSPRGDRRRRPAPPPRQRRIGGQTSRRLIDHGV